MKTAPLKKKKNKRNGGGTSNKTFQVQLNMLKQRVWRCTQTNRTGRRKKKRGEKEKEERRGGKE